MDLNTKLLLRFDGIIEDNSLNKVPITNNGVISSTTQSKFGGYSGYFNGGQYINISSSNLPDFNSDWTIDWWEYRTQTYNDTACVFNLTNGEYNNDRGILVGYTMNSNISVYIASPTTQWDISSGASMGSVLVNQWVHRALVKNGNNYYTFQNGLLITTFTSSLSIRTDLTVGSIGNYANGLRYLFAYVDNFRISNIARWTSNFTVPTEEDYKNNTPLYIKQKGFWVPAKKAYRKVNNSWTELEGSDVSNYITSSSILKPKYVWKKSVMAGVDSDENTLLLLKGNDLKDYSSNNFTIENHGVTQSDESQFGNGSLYFNGSSYLKVAATNKFNFDKDRDMTWEFWIRHNSVDGKFFYFSSDTTGAFFWGSQNGKFITGRSNQLITTPSGAATHGLTTGNWTYLKLVHDAYSNGTESISTFEIGSEIGEPASSEYRFYIDGVKIYVDSLGASSAGNDPNISTSTLIIGSEIINNVAADFLNGYIEAIRISNVIRIDTPVYYFGTKTELGYVTSNNPNKYPSNGLAADGYYYERV